jgi:hypothetical protein
VRVCDVATIPLPVPWQNKFPINVSVTLHPVAFGECYFQSINKCMGMVGYDSASNYVVVTKQLGHCKLDI